MKNNSNNSIIKYDIKQKMLFIIILSTIISIGIGVLISLLLNTKDGIGNITNKFIGILSMINGIIFLILGIRNLSIDNKEIKNNIISTYKKQDNQLLNTINDNTNSIIHYEA